MPSFREDVVPVASMAGLFLVSIGLALFLTPTFNAADVRVFEDEESLANPVIYLGIVLVFTLLVLWLARKGLKRVIQAIILSAVFLSLLYVFQPLAALPLGEPVGSGVISTAIAVAISGALVLALYFHPEWYVVDGVGVAVSAGAAAIFGVSLGLVPALLLLVVFAIYDAIAVYQTKHMIDLADSVLDLRLPVMFVVPRHAGYSFLAERDHLKQQLEEKRERDAMFLGLGDVVIPGILIVAAFAQLPDAVGLGAMGPLVVALATLGGTLVGYAVLMVFVMRGNPQAGLPSLNGGAILGFLAALLPLYGWGPLVDPIRGLFGA